eukprot:506404-Pleurochrysis_carterae.AAC.1
MRRLCVWRVIRDVALVHRLTWGCDQPVAIVGFGGRRTIRSVAGTRSLFCELTLAALHATAIVANVVHDHAPLPVVRVAVVAVRPYVDIRLERAIRFVLGLR